MPHPPQAGPRTQLAQQPECGGDRQLSPIAEHPISSAHTPWYGRFLTPEQHPRNIRARPESPLPTLSVLTLLSPAPGRPYPGPLPPGAWPPRARAAIVGDRPPHAAAAVRDPCGPGRTGRPAPRHTGPGSVAETPSVRRSQSLRSARAAVWTGGLHTCYHISAIWHNL
jgi:hypothetical protein